jgi:hypothetical protein
MRTFRRIAPALTLLIIAPLIGEFLLGDFNVRQIGFIVVFIPVYGAGALLVREIARQSQRGWPTMLLLSLAYALALEGFMNQTLFNPNYGGQHLLAYGFIPKLGTSFNFAIYLMTLHVVWSIASPIAIAEALAGARAREPWLRRPGMIVTTLFMLAGCVFTATFTLKSVHFAATIRQFATVGALIAALVVAAFALSGRAADAPAKGGHAPSVWVVLVVSLLLSSAFQRWFAFAPRHSMNATLSTTVMLLLDGVAVALFRTWSLRAAWGAQHTVAAAAGAVVTYGWISLRRFLVSGGTSLGVPTTPVDIVGQIVLVVAILGLGYLGWRRQVSSAPQP